MSHEAFQQIESRWAFQLPADYRAMWERGWLTLNRPGQFFDFTEPGADYLAVWEMEWMPPEEIADHRFQEWERDGFVPFAFTGTGDHWCWWPERAVEGVPPVVLCPHDDQTGTFHAPTVLTAIYRQALELAGGASGEDESLLRAMLARYVADVGPLLPDLCRGTLEWVREQPLKQWKVRRWEESGLITPEERAERETRDLAFPQMGETFLWHRPEG